MANRCGYLLFWSLASVVMTAALTPSCGGAKPGAPECPYRTPQEWQAFQERHAADGRWGKTCEDGGCDAAFHRTVEEEIAKVFDRCAGLLAAHPGLDACTKNLRLFTPGWLAQHSPDSYGFTVDNHAYFTAQEAADKPASMMIPPAELVAAIPELEKVEDVARHRGWKYVTQDSCLGGGRTFVMIPDPAGKFDQWMLLNLRRAEAGSPGPRVDVDKTMSLLTVQKADAAGNALPRVRVHFRDYALRASGGVGYHVELDEQSNTKCYACHPSGVRQLIPRRTRYLDAKPGRGEPGFTEGGAAPADFALQRLGELDDRLRSYGLNDWDGALVVAQQGPAIGAGQGCTRCHDGAYRGVLTLATSVRQLEEKVRFELAMPPSMGLVRLLERREMKDPPLRADEERALREAEGAHQRVLADLEGDRGPALARWILETRCE